MRFLVWDLLGHAMTEIILDSRGIRAGILTRNFWFKVTCLVTNSVQFGQVFSFKVWLSSWYDIQLVWFLNLLVYIS